MGIKGDNYRRRLYEATEETVDPKTGELKRWIKKYSIKVKAENFYMTYIDNLSGYFCLTSSADKSVLSYLCSIAEYDTGRAFLQPKDRKDACEYIGISIQQFSNSIGKLKDLHLITGDRGFYMINPAIFWKGNSKTRSSLLMDNKLSVQFNFELDNEEVSSKIPTQE